MELRTIAIKDLKFAEYNPRKIDPQNMDRLRRSIREFGFATPNTVNSHPGRENVIIGGHMRTRAAELEGMSEVPCWIVDLDEQKEKLLNMALNSRALQGAWDEDTLASLLVKLNEEDADLSVAFDEDELRVHLNIGESSKTDTDPKRFEVLAVVPPESPRIKEHTRIHCDSMEEYKAIKEAVDAGRITLKTLLDAAGVA